MNPLSPIFVFIVYGIAFFTAYLINLKYKISNDNSRYENIDSLRGLLGLGVFIHHSAVWHQYLINGKWELPHSNLLVQLGQTSVSLFFMITAFLFVSKILNSNKKKINWKDLYISRFYRLVPMYIFSIIILILIVFIISEWQLKVSGFLIIKQLIYWLTFTILNGPDINGSIYTSLINAGVVWSLPYEWLFYFSLPLISIIVIKEKPPKFYIIMSLVLVVSIASKKYVNPHHILSFIGGAITPYLMKYSSPKIKYSSVLFSLVILMSLALILFFRTSENIICKFLIIIVFNLIALGNNLFGILKSSILKFLGEICYSTYLIHGIVFLFVIIYFGFGFEKAKNLSTTEYSLTIFLITPLVVILSFWGYKFIEKPFMNIAKKPKLND
ncbi:MAG: acyltransferase [Candidatus Kapabacteria bacterium]|nr:acyltransferase [Candidatus Kapabacteria bacterium]